MREFCIYPYSSTTTNRLIKSPKITRRIRRICPESASKINNLLWSDFEDFLLKKHISIYEIFEADEEYNQKYLTLNSNDRLFIDLCEKLEPNYYSSIEDIMSSIITPWWEKSINVRNRKDILNPTGYMYSTIPFERVLLAYLWRKGFYDSCISESLETMNGATMTEITYKLNGSADNFPEYAKYLDVSLHWLLCLTDKTPLFSKNGMVDLLFDYYKLLSERNQKFIIMILQKLVSKEITQ